MVSHGACSLYVSSFPFKKSIWMKTCDSKIQSILKKSAQAHILIHTRWSYSSIKKINWTVWISLIEFTGQACLSTSRALGNHSLCTWMDSGQSPVGSKGQERGRGRKDATLENIAVLSSVLTPQGYRARWETDPICSVGKSKSRPSAH